MTALQVRGINQNVTRVSCCCCKGFLYCRTSRRTCRNATVECLFNLTCFQLLSVIDDGVLSGIFKDSLQKSHSAQYISWLSRLKHLYTHTRFQTQHHIPGKTQIVLEDKVIYSVHRFHVKITVYPSVCLVLSAPCDWRDIKQQQQQKTIKQKQKQKHKTNNNNKKKVREL